MLQPPDLLALTAALRQDLGKSAAEAGMSELGLVYAELHWMQRHLRGLMRDRTVPTPLAQFAARSFCSPSPLGTVLIMSPWNYPVLLTLDPLIDALAAGNTAFVKPSAYAPATAAALQALLEECFSPDYVCRRHGRAGRKSGPAARAVRPDLFHGQQGRGPRGAACGGGPADPCGARARRQKPLYRG
jgi:acyl-CoA reductase-like NAD-dependent aldehyde dehydrogenase